MAKLLRSELKSIVKECLVEILSEGIGATNHINENSRHDLPKINNQKRVNKKTKSYLDNIEFGKKQINKSSTPARKTNLTNDPVLNELLADTAQTTLREQVAADSKRRMTEVSAGADRAALKVSNSQPEELFGNEAAGKWAKLAFFDH